MRKALLSGALLAAAAAVVVLLGSWLGDDLQHFALLGAALGGVIGLAPHQPVWGKLGGFATGFVLAWVGFALRAAVLPDSAGGRAVAAFLVIMACVLVCALSAGRIPLWSALVGAAAIVGAYETTYTSSPSQFLEESPTAATTILFAAALGFMATSLLADAHPVAEPEWAEVDGGEPTSTWEPGREANTAAFDAVLAGESK